jgi:hypothetical protein
MRRLGTSDVRGRVADVSAWGKHLMRRRGEFA